MGDYKKPCGPCGGTGKQLMSEGGGPGAFWHNDPCSYCDGMGEVWNGAHLAAALDRVRALHQKKGAVKISGHPMCNICRTMWPCPTIRAIEGDERG